LYRCAIDTALDRFPSDSLWPSPKSNEDDAATLEFVARLAVNVTVSPTVTEAQLFVEPTAHVNVTDGPGCAVTVAAVDVFDPAVAVMLVSLLVVSETLASPAASVTADPLLSVPRVAENTTGTFGRVRPLVPRTVATTCTVPPFWDTVAGFARTVTVSTAAAPTDI
jgi:hypothetical protein